MLLESLSKMLSTCGFKSWNDIADIFVQKYLKISQRGFSKCINLLKSVLEFAPVIQKIQIGFKVYRDLPG